MAWTKKARDRDRIARRLSFEQESGRTQFASGTDYTDAETVHGLWQAAVDTLRPVLTLARIDLFPDPSWGSFQSLAEPVRQGWQTLHEQPGASKTGVGVRVDLTDDAMFNALRDYGIASINCVAYGTGADVDQSLPPDLIVGPLLVRHSPDFPLVYNHDQGASLIFELTGIEHHELASRIAAKGIDHGALRGPLSGEGAF